MINGVLNNGNYEQAFKATRERAVFRDQTRAKAGQGNKFLEVSDWPTERPREFWSEGSDWDTMRNQNFWLWRSPSPLICILKLMRAGMRRREAARGSLRQLMKLGAQWGAGEQWARLDIKTIHGISFVRILVTFIQQWNKDPNNCSESNAYYSQRVQYNGVHAKASL
jgi:hypothetical protein